MPNIRTLDGRMIDTDELESFSESSESDEEIAFDEPNGEYKPFPRIAEYSKSVSFAVSRSSGPGTLSLKKELSKKGLDKRIATSFDDRVMMTVPEPDSRRYDSDAVFDPITKRPTISILRSHFLREGRLTNEAAIAIIRMGKPLLKEEPNLLRLTVPITVCGDIHGQFFDLMTTFSRGGSIELGTKYLFLGDYVDRGDFSTEVMLYLLAIKINYPNSIYMLRGNHEARLMCEYMTFLNECLHKYDGEVYSAFMDLFDCLPLAATISGSGPRDIFCTHGGISPNLNTLEDITKINRFAEPPTTGLFCDLLWADPIDDYDEEDELFEDMTKQQWENLLFAENITRHTSYYFGRKAIVNFLRNNNLSTMIRAHQVQDEGCMYHYFMGEHRGLPFCITVFSAPNYCDSYENRGALLLIDNSTIGVCKYVWKEHPYYLQDFSDCITYSLPMILENVVSILQKLVIQMRIEGPSISKEENQIDEELQSKVEKLFEHTEKIRETQSRFKKVQLKDYHKNMPLFERVLRSDREQEGVPVRARSDLFSRPVRLGMALKSRKSVSQSFLL